MSTVAVVEIALVDPIEVKPGEPLRKIQLRAVRESDVGELGTDLLSFPPLTEEDERPLNPEERNNLARLRNVGVPVDAWGDPVALAEAFGLFSAAPAQPFAIHRNRTVYAKWLERLSGVPEEALRRLCATDFVACLEEMEGLLIAHAKGEHS